MNMFIVLVVVMVSQMYTYVQPSQNLHFKHLQITVCRLPFNKAVLENNIRTMADKTGCISQSSLICLCVYKTWFICTLLLPVFPNDITVCCSYTCLPAGWVGILNSENSSTWLSEMHQEEPFMYCDNTNPLRLYGISHFLRCSYIC